MFWDRGNGGTQRRARRKEEQPERLGRHYVQHRNQACLYDYRRTLYEFLRARAISRAKVMG